MAPPNYRRLLKSTIWHFCRNCRLWPTSDYVSHRGTTPPKKLCNLCRARQRAHDCE